MDVVRVLIAIVGMGRRSRHYCPVRFPHVSGTVQAACGLLSPGLRSCRAGGPVPSCCWKTQDVWQALTNLVQKWGLHKKRSCHASASCVWTINRSHSRTLFRATHPRRPPLTQQWCANPKILDVTAGSAFVVSGVCRRHPCLSTWSASRTVAVPQWTTSLRHGCSVEQSSFKTAILNLIFIPGMAKFEMVSA